MDKEQWKGNMDLLILSLLKHEDMYGFQIINTVSNISESKYKISEGTLYSVLKRLERKKLINSYWGNESQGGRRKYYTITDTGEHMHEEKFSSWILISEIIRKINEEGIK
ncbi:PadR family transcriptional regulator [Gracilibacillus sp. S3-1-1]|uniref:PadR family transcriptional regulator n=1 Tax=Gracilibacillus pellucidus TaxID=3095368 RepID=A0ACC6M692_9BACI|nr:PadR family transcriptional regulator [Gracilibacillus sp. S3-1-1]MDX8046287.1 PadR family transcriptional regulator [Gracilibacillus sp. S3-1-1]